MLVLMHHPNPSGQYVDKNNCMQQISDGKKWEGTGKPLKSLVAATFEKAITYVLAESPIRNAEARGSIPLCSTSNSHLFSILRD